MRRKMRRLTQTLKMPAELRLMQAVIMALGGQKLGMGAGLGNTRLVHHNDA